ncbi:UNVERIFIED_ORG: hypothetical protein LHK14_14870 [Roseateles sp. XES5]|nr:hypothetical protein [Roseateles sp. XES5]
MKSLAAFTHRRNFLFDMDFPGIVHCCGNGVGDDAETVVRHEGRCPTALRGMKLAKGAGQKPRIVFRFTTHIPHLF